MRAARLIPLAAVLAAAAPAVTVAQEVPIQVELRDGTTIPLQDWTLSYEYAVWDKGTPAVFAQTRRHDARMLIEDKDEYPLAAGALEFQYGKRRSQREVDGEMTTVEIDHPAGFTFTSGGDRKEFDRPKPPHREMLAGNESGDQLFQPRGLDLRGSTLTGTRRSFCLFTYTSMVECSADPAQQVVRITFP
jgi:hypothetical protein